MLLMDQRFKQFSGLVDNCEFSTGEKETTCTDLQGFWDMVYFQVGMRTTMKIFFVSGQIYQEKEGSVALNYKDVTTICTLVT